MKPVVGATECTQVVDNFNRESLAIRAGQRLTGVAVLEAVANEHGRPPSIRVDNGK